MCVILIIDGVEYECVPRHKKETIKQIITEEQITRKTHPIIAYLNKWGNNKLILIKHLINTNSFNYNTIASYMNCTVPEAIELISKLSQASLILKRGQCYIKSELGKNILKQEYSKETEHE